MPRPSAHAREPGGGAAPVAPRWTRALPLEIALRLIAAPLAALAAAVAGLLFALLLPICGVATICEGVAKASWRFVRDTLTHLPRPRSHRA